MMRSAIVLALLALLATASCRRAATDARSDDGDSSSAAQEGRETGPAARPPAEPTLVELAVPEDFRLDAEQSINEQNYRAELARIQAEVMAAGWQM